MERYLINHAYSLNEQMKCDSQPHKTKILKLLLENSIATLLRLSKSQQNGNSRHGT